MEAFRDGSRWRRALERLDQGAGKPLKSPDQRQPACERRAAPLPGAAAPSVESPWRSDSSSRGAVGRPAPELPVRRRQWAAPSQMESVVSRLG